MVDWTALVPIEAEEEGQSMYTDPDTGEVLHDFFPDSRADGNPVHTHTRLVTPCDEA